MTNTFFKSLNVIKSWLCLLALLPCIALAHSIVLEDITVSNGDESARLGLVLTHPTKYRIFTLGRPDRLVVDLTKTELSSQWQKMSFSHSIIKNVRSGYPIPGTLRLVFELENPAEFRAQVLQNKIMVDLYQKKNKVSTASILSTPSAVPVTKKAITKIYTPSQTVTVVIDPGHGGKDPGAIGDYGTKEKNVVLAISKRLAMLINQQSNMHAVLTRDGDYFIPLRQRLKLARKGKADIFIAIHADSYFNNRAEGASVYALSHHGATSEAARWLAKRDNYSELGGVDLSELEDKDPVLRSVLIDLAQTATTTDSLRLGSVMLDALEQVTDLHYTRVEQAPFMVLKSPDIPSILVETGFISNPNEERKLRDPAYQNKVAQALFNGIQHYIKKYSVAHV